MPLWSDDPATSSTHIRVVHIGELRRAIDFYRSQAGLPAVSWTDNPLTSNAHIRAVHFTELRSAIQDLWTYHGLGSLPNWSVGSSPSTSRQVSARDMNDLRSWVNQVDPPLSVWSGFHWCSPVTQANNQQALSLFQSSKRLGAVIIVSESPGGTDTGFTDACDQVMNARNANGLGRSLDQSITRIYFSTHCHPDLTDIPNVTAADTWLRGNGYYSSLQHFVDNGGRNVIIFNELNVWGAPNESHVCTNGDAEPQYGVDQRVMGYLSYALKQHFAAQGVQIFTLFPGPSELLPDYSGAWDTSFFDYWLQRYDLRDPVSFNVLTFDAYFGQDNVDSHLWGKTMLWHAGNGIFDRVALHCYEDDPTRYVSADPTYNRALQYLSWMASIDNTGWVYVTETAGNTGCNDCNGCQPTDYTCHCGDLGSAGSGLATFEVLAASQFNQSGPGFLQAVYGYILMPSNCGATSNGWHAINTTFMGGYLSSKTFP